MIVDSFNNHISNKYFKILSPQKDKLLNLVEKNSGGRKSYKVSLDISSFKKDECILVSGLDEMKDRENSKYITQPPKDCDYILINESKKKIFYIELKDTDFTNTDILKQLEAGKKWLEHLFFCADYNDWCMDDYKEYFICIKYNNGRPSRHDRNCAKEVEDKKIYIRKGNRFLISAFNETC